MWEIPKPVLITSIAAKARTEEHAVSKQQPDVTFTHFNAGSRTHGWELQPIDGHLQLQSPTVFVGAAFAIQADGYMGRVYIDL